MFFIVCLIVRFCFRLCLVWLVKVMSKVSVVVLGSDSGSVEFYEWR